jgi:hypothetical protein
MAPTMPDASHPQAAAWVAHLRDVVGTPNEQTYFVGHSLGCVTILRYLALQPKTVRVGGAVLMAGFTSSLNISEIENFLSEPIDAKQVRLVCPNIAAFASTNDHYVPVQEGKILQKQFGAHLEIVESAGHFGSNDGYTEFPGVLEKLLDFV